MKIVFLSRYQNQFERGAEIFVKELSKRLAKNHLVDVLVGKDADSIVKVLSGGYDIVIPVNGRLQGLKMSLFRLIGGYKLLISGHSGRGWDDILNIAIAKPDIFVALTDSMLKWAKKWAWGTRLIKIPNGIDLQKFSPEGEKINIDLEKPIVLSVGALVWYKHHERVIEAISRLDDVSLLVVGDGDLKDKLQEMGNKTLGKRFKIMNPKYQDMQKLYRSVDLFTLPSWDREAFGIVYLEAMASGLAVVAPNDLSRKEIIGDGGLLVNVENSAEYAKSIQEALNRNWGNKPRQQAMKFSWEKVANKYDRLIQEFNK